MDKVTMLLDNISNNKHYKNSHGLSMLIEFDGLKILFDTGPNRNFIKNAEKLSIDLDSVDTIIISHGHSDHVTGLKYLNLDEKIIYSGNEVCTPKFLKIFNFYKYVGAPKEINHNNFTYITEIKEIRENIFIIPLKKSDRSDKNLYKKIKQEKRLDDFSDELALVLIKDDQLIIFTGCSHHGIIEIIQYIKKIFPNKNIKSIIGGFHMIGIPYINNLGMSKESIKEIGYLLNQEPIEKFYTCHCTGLKAFKILKSILVDRLDYVSTGEAVEI